MSEPERKDDELLVEELEEVAGGTTINVNGCNGGSCAEDSIRPDGGA
jgi:hypothetical protein